MHRTATTDDKRLQSSLKKLSVNTIPGIEEVNMIKDDGSVIHFNNPKVQASLAANTFAVTGHADNKQITELLPGESPELRIVLSWYTNHRQRVFHQFVRHDWVLYDITYSISKKFLTSTISTICHILSLADGSNA